jgi:hypothetical protein
MLTARKDLKAWIWTYGCLNRGEIMCPYDEKAESYRGRVHQCSYWSARHDSNLIDRLSKEGRQSSSRQYFQVRVGCPTYEEVVAVWRPLPEKEERKTWHFSSSKFVTK